MSTYVYEIYKAHNLVLLVHTLYIDVLFCTCIFVDRYFLDVDTVGGCVYYRTDEKSTCY